MEIHNLHRWDLSPSEAIALQRELAEKVVLAPALEQCQLVAGADVSNDRFSNVLYAGVVLLRADDCSVIERRSAVVTTTFPYVPGLLSFREAPVLLAAFGKLSQAPDLVLCDGQGIAHPRRLGLACHVGLWLELPCVGCAKSRLTGKYVEPGPGPGARTPLVDHGETIGAVVRTRQAARPLFISPGHKIDRESAVRWVLALGRGRRLPEPTRLAHEYVNQVRTGAAT